MGVAGLWDIAKPVGQTHSLTHMAVVEGFEKNTNKLRGYRIGIDASIWFFHAECGKEGENPQLRLLFFRCATLMKTPFLPLFIFDGPLRPKFKRGKRICGAANPLTTGMKAIIEAFGYEWRTAPGEAEAELAYLNRIGIIDGVLSDDSDNFLFGALTVIRNPSNNLSGNRANPILNSEGKDDKNHVKVYRAKDLENDPSIKLTRGGCILIGIISGGDYGTGVAGCGAVIAHGLAKCGFGDTLYDAARNLSREELENDFLPNWRHEVRTEIRTNARGLIGRKGPALASRVLDTFPDIDILMSYVNPTTSESLGKGDRNLTITWSREPDLGRLAGICEQYFEWGYKEAVIKRFRDLIWTAAVLRIIRRAVLILDEKAAPFQRTVALPSTPRKNNAVAAPPGTPSRMISHFFSSVSQDDDDDEETRLIHKIHSSRNHPSTDEILEYRLEIKPAQLVTLTAAGLQGTRRKPDDDEWQSELEAEAKAAGGESESDEDGKPKKKSKGPKKPPPDPQSVMRMWMPASMVRLVEPGLVEDFEDVDQQKRDKKAGRGKPKSPSKTGAKGKGKGKNAEKAVSLSLYDEDDDDNDRMDGVEPIALPRFVLLPPKAKPKASKSKSKAPDDSKASHIMPTFFPVHKPTTSGKAKSSSLRRIDLADTKNATASSSKSTAAPPKSPAKSKSSLRRVALPETDSEPDVLDYQVYNPPAAAPKLTSKGKENEKEKNIPGYQDLDSDDDIFAPPIKKTTIPAKNKGSLRRVDLDSFITLPEASASAPTFMNDDDDTPFSRSSRPLHTRTTTEPAMKHRAFTDSESDGENSPPVSELFMKPKPKPKSLPMDDVISLTGSSSPAAYNVDIDIEIEYDDSEFLNKTSRKSQEHTSPRRRQDDVKDPKVAGRPMSPSPARPRKLNSGYLTSSETTSSSVSRTSSSSSSTSASASASARNVPPPSQPLAIIEILSDSDTDDPDSDRAPPMKIALMAPSKPQIVKKDSEPARRSKTRELSQQPLQEYFKPQKRTTAKRVVNESDIIDLT